MVKNCTLKTRWDRACGLSPRGRSFRRPRPAVSFGQRYSPVRLMWSHFSGDRCAKAFSVMVWPSSRKAETARFKYTVFQSTMEATPRFSPQARPNRWYSPYMATGQGRVPRAGRCLGRTHIANCGLGAFRKLRINRLELEMSFLADFRWKTGPQEVLPTPLLEGFDRTVLNHLRYTPWPQGGKTTVENGQVACPACNSAKGGKA
jgi:hypothetical protein